MKSKTVPARLRESQGSDNENVRKEIQGFFRAIDSYPDRFARDPSLSFDEHRRTLTDHTKMEPGQKD